MSVYKFIAVPALLSSPVATPFAQSARRTVVHVASDFAAGEKVLPTGGAGRPDTVTTAVTTQE